VPGLVPNAFNLLLQSDFSINYMHANSAMFPEQLRAKAFASGPVEEPQPQKKAKTTLKQTSASKY